MPSWKKHFQVVAANSKVTRNLGSRPDYVGPGAYGNKFVSYLPEIYSGPPNRLERYQQYDQMDQDSEVHSSLDTIADFATNTPEKEDVPFEIFFKGKEGPTQAEIDILNTAMRQWCYINSFQQRIWRIFRSTIKYGDQFFIRDPETFELYWVDPYKVQSVIVNPAEGKKPEYYLINDLDINVQTKVGTIPRSQAVNQIQSPSMVNNPAGAAGASTAYNNQAQAASWVGKTKGVSGQGINELAVNAMHVVHISLSEGLDANWPFGNSILESVFKVYKQKELLEDALIIYRVQRAPERRVFYVDVGNMPAHKAMAYVERIKNEIHQRRIPNRSGGGTSILDAAYNPLCLALDTKIPLLDGRTLTLSDLIEEYKQGKENWTYGCNPNTFDIEPAKITNAQITKKNTNLIRIWLDNGKYIDSTYDHKFVLRSGEEVRADQLIEGNSLMPFYTDESAIGKSCKTKYQRVFHNGNKSWQFIHRMVADNLKLGELVYNNVYENSKKQVIHHVDLNRFNNDPKNLVWMNAKDHWLLHSDMSKTKEHSQKISNRNKKMWMDLSFKKKVFDNQKIKFDEKILMFIENTIGQKIQHADDLINDLNNNGQFISYFRELNKNNTSSIKNQRFTYRHLKLLCRHFGFKNWRHFRNCQFVKKQIVKNNFYQNISFSKKICDQLLLELSSNNKINTILKNLNSNLEFISEWKKINNKDVIHKKAKRTKTFDVFNYKHLRTFAVLNSFKNVSHMQQQLQLHNHKVVKVEYLNGLFDTGDITIETPSGSHWFATDAGVFVHNSIMEDYFFPTSAEGRGSKVDTLPGGENLGQIDDLRFFNNKLMRGLRVPSAYLPTGPDDGQQSYTDGRVGTAYIQEFRFSKYVTRLQHLMITNFDLEFKLFLAKRGIRIDSSSFELRFWTPQNFGKYRQMEIDAAQINIFQPLADVKWISKRFLAKRFLGLTDEEILENERMWMEENPKATKGQAIPTESPGLGSVGIRPSSSDLGEPDLDLEEPEGESPGGDTGKEDRNTGGEGGAAGGEGSGGEAPPPESTAPGDTFGA